MIERPSGQRSGPLRFLLALLALVLVSGCVSVPTSGPVAPVTADQQQSGAQNVQVPVRPEQDASAAEIVTGFLAAYALGGSDEKVAREYLVPSVAQNWRPDGSVLVYGTDEDSPSLKEDASSYSYDIIGQVSKSGVYSTPNVGSSFWEPRLVRDGGQWRISNPPPALLISVSLFKSLYHQYFLYYFDATYSVLVPYPIWLRLGTDDRLTPVALLASLRAPDDPIYRTARNAFDVDLTPQVTISDSIANVELADQSIPTGEEQQQQFVAQIVYTLSQLTQVKGVQLNGGYDLPGPTPGSKTVKTVMAAGAYQAYAPADNRVAPTLYGLTTKDGIVSISGPADKPVAQPVIGAPDVSARAAASFAVAADANRFAVVDKANRRLTVTTVGHETTPVKYDGVNLLPPQFTRFGEVWTVDQIEGPTGPVSRLIAIDRDGMPHTVSDDLGSGRVVAFRISPDGTRVAVVRKTGNTYAISISPIDRGSSPAIALGSQVPFQPDNSALPKTLTVDDVAWSDPTKLLVLGDNELYEVALDSSGGKLIGRVAGWEVDRITATTPPAGSPSAPVVFSVKKPSWLLDQGAWRELRLSGLTYATYPG